MYADYCSSMASIKAAWNWPNAHRLSSEVTPSTRKTAVFGCIDSRSADFFSFASGVGEPGRCLLIYLLD
jgi:hypothetical protein